MRNLKTLAFAGLLGVFAMASDASACHKKKCACPTTTTVVCAPAPVVECAPVKQKCKMSMPKLCHKKAAPVALPRSPMPLRSATPLRWLRPRLRPSGCELMFVI